MQYGSICSGIEAASVAWEPLGWSCQWVSEIDKFANRVLAYRYPEVPNLKDFTTINSCNSVPVDLLIGGTPCQAFSVAGQRAGLSDPRGFLTLEFIKLLGRIKPQWFVWENVPGVLSIDKGRTFGTILREVEKLGYGFAYRILDAQYFGVPQRRRRLFLIGYFGDWRPPATVLFEPETRTSTHKTRAQERKISHTLSTRTRGGSLEYFDQWNRIGRLYTPLECERLQGFPDNWTLVPDKKGQPVKDGPRYKAIGNSMSVPVIRWLGERIEQYHDLMNNGKGVPREANHAAETSGKQG